MRILFLTAAAVLSTAAAPAAKNWTATVVMTPEGGFRMGNPAAKVKLVEYGSLTCGHCANFAQQSATALPAHVRSGKVSFEYRNLVLNGIDVTASLLARCAGPAGFFRLTDEIYHRQSGWAGTFNSVAKAERDQINALPEKQRLIRVAERSGLMRLAMSKGLSNGDARRCLASEEGLKRLERLSEGAAAQGITGTPTFLINGQRVQANTWATIEPLIVAAARR